MESFGAIFAIFFIIMWVVIMALVIGSMVLWVLMLIDVINRRNWRTHDEKTIWLLIVILAGGIGALIYYIEIYKKYGKAY